MQLFDQAVEAIITGDTDTLRKLLNDNPDLITSRSSSPHKATLLHYIAANGIEDELQKSPANAVEITRMLLDAGAKVDALSQIYGGGPNSTTLCLMVSSAHPAEAGVMYPLVKLLCEHGAEVNGLDDDGVALFTALLFMYSDAVKALVDCGARLDNIAFAAAAGRLDLVEQFLNGQIPTRDNLPETHPFSLYFDKEYSPQVAMVKAGLCGQLEVVKMLFESGVSVNARPYDNRTALHEAAWMNQQDTVEFLLHNGADAKIVDTHFKKSAAEMATLAGHHKLGEFIQTYE